MSDGNQSNQPMLDLLLEGKRHSGPITLKQSGIIFVAAKYGEGLIRMSGIPIL